MATLIERYINYFFQHAKKLAILAAIWFIYSLCVTYAFADVMEHTLTPHQDAAFLEAGVLAILIGNDIITFCLMYQFTALHFYRVQGSKWLIQSHIAVHSQGDAVGVGDGASARDHHRKRD